MVHDMICLQGNSACDFHITFYSTFNMAIIGLKWNFECLGFDSVLDEGSNNRKKYMKEANIPPIIRLTKKSLGVIVGF